MIHEFGIDNGTESRFCDSDTKNLDGGEEELTLDSNVDHGGVPDGNSKPVPLNTGISVCFPCHARSLEKQQRLRLRVLEYLRALSPADVEFFKKAHSSNAISRSDGVYMKVLRAATRVIYNSYYKENDINLHASGANHQLKEITLVQLFEECMGRSPIEITFGKKQESKLEIICDSKNPDADAVPSLRFFHRLRCLPANEEGREKLKEQKVKISDDEIATTLKQIDKLFVKLQLELFRQATKEEQLSRTIFKNEFCGSCYLA